jgi:hypothetical protein
MTTLNVSLSEEARRFVEEQAAKRGLTTGAEFLERLVTRAMEEERLERLVVEGVERGGRILADDAYWERKRAMLIERARGAGRA